MTEEGTKSNGGKTDPTRLTKVAVDDQAEQNRRDLDNLQELIGSRLDGMDLATTLRLKVLDQVPSEIDRHLTSLRELHAERFSSIELQFRERDIRTDQAATASKQALDAALLAAKELVGQQNTANVEAAAKAETSFTKQIDQTSVLIQTLEKALTDRILEIKERLDRGEGAVTGSRETRTNGRDNLTAVLAGISVFLVFLSLALGLFLAMKK